MELSPMHAETSSMDEPTKERLKVLCLNAEIFFEPLRLLQAVVELGAQHGDLIVVETTRAKLARELGWHANTVGRYMRGLAGRELPWLRLLSTPRGYRAFVMLNGSTPPSFFGHEPSEQHRCTTQVEPRHHKSTTRAPQEHHRSRTTAPQEHHKSTTAAEQAPHTSVTPAPHGTVPATRPPAIQLSSLRSESSSAAAASAREEANRPVAKLPPPRLPELRRAVATPPAQPTPRAELPVVLSPEPSVEEVQVEAPAPVREEPPATVETGDATSALPAAPCESPEAGEEQEGSSASTLTAHIIAVLAKHGHEVGEEDAARVADALRRHCASEDEARAFTVWKADDLDGRVGATRIWLTALASRTDVEGWRRRGHHTPRPAAPPRAARREPSVTQTPHVVEHATSRMDAATLEWLTTGGLR